MNNLFQKLFGIKIGHIYRYDGDYGGKFSDGSPRKPIKYIPTEVRGGRVFYDVVSPQVGFLRGDSASIFAFFVCYCQYENF